MAIEFSGDYRILASQHDVWAALNDPVVLQRCIAGCRQLEKISDHEFNAMVVASVGPISATFRGNLVLSELDPPRGYVLTGRGQGGAAGFASMTARIVLLQEDGSTLLRYEASADIGGKLASVGSRLIQSVAKQNADNFFKAFSRQFDESLPPDGHKTAAEQLPISPDMQPERNATTRPSGGLTALVPAWIVLFASGISVALGYCLALLR